MCQLLGDSQAWSFLRNFPRSLAGTQHLQMILTAEGALQPPKHRLPSLPPAPEQPQCHHQQGTTQQRQIYLQPIPLLQDSNESCVLHGWHSFSLSCTSGRCSLEALQGTAPAVGCLWPGGTGEMFWLFRTTKTCLVLTLPSHGQAGQTPGTLWRSREVKFGMCQQLICFLTAEQASE